MQQSLRVLIVDDERTNRMVFEAMLLKMGHVTFLAESGEAALKVYAEQGPFDIVLMDVMMPGMDGFETVRRIRAQSDVWVPILIVSALGDEEAIVSGIESGADDYLSKPVRFGILKAKIKMLHDRVLMSRQLREQNRQLMDHQEKIHEESQMAQEFMRRLAALEQINDPLVRFHLNPAEDFSGDLISVARTPAGELHVMLADSTGHGLTAALAVTPVLQPFQTMTQKGFSIGAIATEINRKVREYLPRNRFVAVALLALDSEKHRVEVWNGGCPPVIMMRPNGTIKQRFRSAHLPLGVLATDEFDATVEHGYYGVEPSQIFMCSDGAVESAGDGQLQVGLDMLLDCASKSSPNHRFDNILRMLEAHFRDRPAQDDVALVWVECPTEDVLRPDVAPSLPKSVASQGDKVSWRLALTLSAAQLAALDVVPFLLSMVEQVEQGNKDGLSGRLFLILSELFNNALDHGLLQLDSTLKHDPYGMERYYEERASRLKNLRQGEVVIELDRIESDGDPSLQVMVRDSGEGFDVDQLLSKVGGTSEARHGRGISLVKSLSARMEYSDGGRAVKVCLPL